MKQKTYLILPLIIILISTSIASAICDNWTDQTSAGSRDWSAVSMSSDGSKIVATEYNGDIFTSNNGGYDWVDQTNSGALDWSAVASSSDGTKIVAIPYSVRIRTSNDSGTTWIEQNSNYGLWVSVASSSDGTKIVVGADGDDIYTSNDSGITWTDQTNSGASSWYHIDSSSDGTIIIGMIYGGQFFISNDSGITWNNHNELGADNWVGVAMSSSGSKIAIATNSGNLYISDDYGTTWTNQSVGFYLNGLAMSKDGSTMGVWQAIGDIFISNDNGTTFTDQISAGSRDWSGIAFSDNGSKIVAVGFNDTIGDIWTYGECPPPCIENWGCDTYTTCQINNTMSCQSVTDINLCGNPFTGNLTDYDLNCTYQAPTPTNANDLTGAVVDNGVKLIKGFGTIAIFFGIILSIILICFIIRKARKK